MLPSKIIILILTCHRNSEVTLCVILVVDEQDFKVTLWKIRSFSVQFTSLSFVNEFQIVLSIIRTHFICQTLLSLDEI